MTRRPTETCSLESLIEQRNNFSAPKSVARAIVEYHCVIVFWPFIRSHKIVSKRSNFQHTHTISNWQRIILYFKWDFTFCIISDGCRVHGMDNFVYHEIAKHIYTVHEMVQRVWHSSFECRCFGQKQGARCAFNAQSARMSKWNAHEMEWWKRQRKVGKSIFEIWMLYGLCSLCCFTFSSLTMLWMSRANVYLEQFQVTLSRHRCFPHRRINAVSLCSNQRIFDGVVAAEFPSFLRYGLHIVLSNASLPLRSMRIHLAQELFKCVALPRSDVNLSIYHSCAIFLSFCCFLRSTMCHRVRLQRHSTAPKLCLFNIETVDRFCKCQIRCRF